MMKDDKSTVGTERKGSWADEVLLLEQTILDGGMPPLEEIRAIPEAFRLKSPVLLRAECENGLLGGSVQDTKRLLEACLKGYAALADESSMLAMMGMLAFLYEQVGDRHESSAIVSHLKQEWKRTPERCSGFVPWALARSAANELIDQGEVEERDPEDLFFAAADRFRQEGRTVWAAFALLDRLLFDPQSAGGADWRLWVNWVKRHMADKPYGEALSALLSEDESAVTLCGSLPARYAYLSRAILYGAADEQPPQSLAQDIEVQLYASAAKIKRALAEADAETAAVEMGTLEKLQRLVSTPAIRKLAAALNSTIEAARLAQGSGIGTDKSLALVTEEDKDLAMRVIGAVDLAPGASGERGSGEHGKQPESESVKWRVKLFDGIAFSSVAAQDVNPVWKRRKAGELLVYLLLQPGYRAGREQVTERIFGEGDPSKLSNQLYVTLHDLRQTLREIGLSDDPVYARRGVIGIEEHLIEIVDTEKYLTLSRVGDQLWTSDREAACGLYDEALPLYGHLGAEFSGAEWLERMREQLLDRQTSMLKRLAVYYTEIHDDIRAEQRIAEWIAFRPDQEEGYDLMIRYCLNQDRRAEAVAWYRRLERVCREELGIEPREEIQRLLWGH